MLRPGSGFFLLADALGHEQRGPALGHAFGSDGHLAHVVPAGKLEHDVGHHLLENGAQTAGAILEEMMTDIMFELPSRDDVREVAITAECVTEGRAPLLVTERVRQKKEA